MLFLKDILHRKVSFIIFFPSLTSYYSTKVFAFCYATFKELSQSSSFSSCHVFLLGSISFPVWRESLVNSNSFCSSKLFSDQLLPCLRFVFTFFFVQKWTEEGIFAVHIDFYFFMYRKFETLSYFNFVFPVMRSFSCSVSYA